MKAVGAIQQVLCGVISGVTNVRFWINRYPFGAVCEDVPGMQICGYQH